MRNFTSKETIWHFTCEKCEEWWSYSTGESWKPTKNKFCPHCGKEQGALTSIEPPNNLPQQPAGESFKSVFNKESNKHIISILLQAKKDSEEALEYDRQMQLNMD
jgi:hypothetical protein